MHNKKKNSQLMQLMLSTVNAYVEHWMTFRMSATPKRSRDQGVLPWSEGRIVRGASEISEPRTPRSPRTPPSAGSFIYLLLS